MGRESPRGEEEDEEEEEEEGEEGEEPKAREEEEGIRWRPPPTFNYNCPSLPGKRREFSQVCLLLKGTLKNMFNAKTNLDLRRKKIMTRIYPTRNHIYHDSNQNI